MNNDYFGVTRDAICVTREHNWQIASLVTPKSLFTVTHALFFIYLSSTTVPSLSIDAVFMRSTCMLTIQNWLLQTIKRAENKHMVEKDLFNHAIPNTIVPL